VGTDGDRGGESAGVHELRFDPFLDEWVMIACARHARPDRPSGDCPFCVGGLEAPEPYRVKAFPNRFPALVPGEGAQREVGPYGAAPPAGACEVVLYSPDHDARLYQLAQDQVEELVDLWAERTAALGARSEIEYVLVFENRGEEVGVTIHHPHGQIYAFSFVPPLVARRLASETRHFRQTGRCLRCEAAAFERSGPRLVIENDSWSGYIPFAARWPFGVHLVTRRHVGSLPELDAGERRDLARILRRLVAGFDALFDRSFPFMMLVYQTPTDGREHPEAHLHIEFFPPLRGPRQVKYVAGVETGTGTHANPTSPEEKAAELRAALERAVGGQAPGREVDL